jgi:hypothetical protein
VCGQGRCHGNIAVGGKAVADCADVLVDAEDLLDDDDAALGRTFRIGAIGPEFVLIGGGE